MSRRAAIYARYSTDKQDERSISDQISDALSWALKNSFIVVETYSDAAMSGGSMMGRDGLFNLLADARTGKFDTIIVESLDRLSRDMGDLADIHKRLTFCGVEIATLNEGVANTITIGLRGIIGQLYREDLAQKTRRGMRGKVSEGLSAGGRSYGYDLHPRNKGELIINETEADTVRRIFADYAGGKSPQTIAADLNREGIKAPRGVFWQPSTIYGWQERGTGILRNPLYNGQIVWNKRRFLKDPETGKRTSRTNPASEWQYAEAEHLRLIERPLFDEVQRLCAGKERTPAEAASMRRGKRLLAGLLKCAGCGASLTVVGKDKSGRNRMVCSAHRNGLPCPNPRTFYYEKIEALVMDTLRKGLQEPEYLAEYVRVYNETRLELARQTEGRRLILEKRINSLDAYLNRLVDQLGNGLGDPVRIGEQMQAKEAEFKTLKAELALEPAKLDVVALHPQTIATYQSQLGDLQAALNACGTRTPRMAELMRELVHSITVHQDPAKYGGIIVEIQGNLRHLLGDKGPDVKSWDSMVAGARFELTTFRL